MIIDITTKTTQQIDIEPEEAFRVLCKTLNMDYILDEDIDYQVLISNIDDEKHVYVDHVMYDDRGDLFVALRNVAVQIFPNVGFR